MTADANRICAELEEHIPEIVDAWESLTREKPWLELPEDARVDHIPSLVRALAKACVGGRGQRAAREEVVRIARLHGQHRREAGMDDHILFVEYHLLRDAIWTSIQARHAVSEARYVAISRIDTSISAATRASLLGFHGAESDDASLEALVADGPWPVGTGPASPP